MFACFFLIDINEGMAKFYGGEERGVIELFTSALEGHEKPSNRILNLLARSHSDLEQHEEAVDYFTEAIAVRDDSFNRTWRAMQYFGNEDCHLAFTDADKALGTNPYVETGFDTRVQSLLIRGHCGEFQGQAKKAVADIGEAIRLAPNSDYSQAEIDYLRGEHQAWLQVAIEDRGGSP
ncbi:MAG: tetratricopeptide repeat protein [Chloroflexi bacterium]|nr:tetratricopeptide repeat protein [Chloroflexota bacterium]